MITLRKRSWFRSPLVLAEWACGGALLLMEACRLVRPHWLPSVVFGTYRFYLYLPTLLLLAVLIRDRRWRVHAPTALLAGVFVVSYGGQFLPKRPVRADDAISVVTFNVAAEADGSSALWSYLEREAPDIVGLQEIDADSDLLRHLRESGYAVRHRRYRASGGQGIAIAARPPCRLGREIGVGGHSSHRWSYLASEIELLNDDGTIARTFNAIVLHLASFGMTGSPPEDLYRNLRSVRRATPWQLADTDTLLDRVRGYRDPTVLLGDFNSTPEQDVHRRIRRSMHDAWLAKGFGYGGTRTYGLPLRIDYLYTSRHFRTLAVRRGPTGLSDHRPVLATIALNGARRK